MGTSLIVAYGIGIGVMILFFLIAMMMANNVPFVPGGADVGKRRGIFWVWCALTPIASIAINMIFWATIEVDSAKQKYLAATFIAAAVGLALYILAGAIVGFSTRGKLQRWPF